jgi:Protein of unknown function (DUF2970)
MIAPFSSANVRMGRKWPPQYLRRNSRCDLKHSHCANHADSAHYNTAMEQKPNFFQAVIAVLWAFIGIRKGDSSLADRGIKPAHFVAAGILAAALFVIVLNIIVRIIMKAAMGT